MADVGGGLRDATGKARDQRGGSLPQEDLSHVVVVPRDFRAFSVVDPADHGQQRERQDQRQIVGQVAKAGENPQIGMRPGEPHHGDPGQFDSHAGDVHCAEPVVNERSRDDREQHARQAQRNLTPRDQRVEHEAQGQNTRDGVFHELDQGEKTNQHERDPGERA